MGSHFTAEFIDAARAARMLLLETGASWTRRTSRSRVGWRYLNRAVDQHSPVIDVLPSMRRNAAAARGFFTRALRATRAPVEVTTDRALAYPQVIGEAAPAARHVTEQ
ncbi:MAG TPA: DDE-type integrase/transposase/recombinase [Jatrophihabitantaceae bacterium]|nr:DDE-type integrase/transposase/recombinase [Jatrophihabitantaceae bacterium]